MIYGIFDARKLLIDAVPDITDNQVQIITVSPSLGAPDVERFITFPLEQANNNIAGIKQMRSFSRFGLSVIVFIVFKDEVDLHFRDNRLQKGFSKFLKIFLLVWERLLWHPFLQV
ncbi:MAG: efflux RND transporter permease subunit [Cloacibacterium normanense]